MNLDRTVEIAGLPIKTVRDAIRETNRHDNNDHDWTVEKLGDHLKISATHAEWLCEGLREQGILERAPQPDTRWYSRGLYYRVSHGGTRFTNANMLKRIDRARVDKLLAGLLERVEAINANNELCCFVNEIRLFGSAADAKAESFADVDICYVLARRKRPAQYKQWTDWNISRAEQSGRQSLQFFEMLLYGETGVKRRLKNRCPYLSLHDLDDVVSIGADSIRLYIAPEGAIEADDGSMSGKALSQAALKDATKNAATRGKERQDKKTSTRPAIKDEPPRDRMVRAVKSLAFDILRAVDESAALEALERSIEAAYKSSPINGESFRAYIEQILLPTLRAGDIVVMDNLGSHKSKAVREAIRSVGARRLFLPAYSPDLNPIEQVFAKLKTLLRKARARTGDAVTAAIAALLPAFSQHECANYFVNAGYASE